MRPNSNLCPSAIFRIDLLDASKNGSLLTPTGVPTYRVRGTIDVAFCSQLGAICEIVSDLQITSDLEKLISVIQNVGNMKEFEGKLRYKSLDEKLF